MPLEGTEYGVGLCYLVSLFSEWLEEHSNRSLVFTVLYHSGKVKICWTRTEHTDQYREGERGKQRQG